MKQKVLLIGTDEMMKSQFFSHMEDSFEMVSSSIYYNDMLGHVNFFGPDIIVLCIKNEQMDTIEKYHSLKQRIKAKNIGIVAISTDDQISDINKQFPDLIDKEIKKPISIQSIKDILMDYLLSFGGASEEISISNLMSRIEQASGVENANAGSIDSHAQEENPSTIARMRVSAKELEKDSTGPLDIRSDSRIKRVLVVDDDKMMLKMIKRHIEDNYEVATAISAKIAMSYLEKRTVDLILLDYEMPEIDGPTMLSNIRNNPLTENTPVVFITGVDDSTRIQRVLALNPQGYLLKPIDQKKLVKTIHDIIG